MIAFKNFDADYDEDKGLRIKIEMIDLLPSFFGTWNQKDALDGLFGLFVVRSNGDQKTGIILDGLGAASFEGIINSEYVNFVKKYLPEAIDRGAAKGPLRYVGEKHVDEKIKEFYRGKFTGEDENGVFFMYPAELFNLPKDQLRKALPWLIEKDKE